MNINTCTRLFITGIYRTGQIAHIFRRILLITFFEFLNFYRTADFAMQNVVTTSSTISSIPRYETGQGFCMVGYDEIWIYSGKGLKVDGQKVGGHLQGSSGESISTQRGLYFQLCIIYSKVSSFCFTPKSLRCKKTVFPRVGLPRRFQKAKQGRQLCTIFFGTILVSQSGGKTGFLHLNLFGVKRKEKILG